MYQSSDRTRPDSNATNYVCGSDSLPTVSRDLLLHADPLTSLQSHSPFQMLMRRQTAPRGCPTSKKIVYTGVALDCTYITKHGSVQAARERALSNFLSVSNLFSKQFNMQIGVLDVVAFPQCNDTSSPAFNVPCSPAFDMGDRLSAFSQWRGTRQDGAGLWHLYTACSSGSTIGLAWLNMVCNSRAFSQAAADGSTEYVSGTGVTASPPSLPPDGEWLITAHEIGHNMGGRHDCTPNTDCSSGGSNLGCCSCAAAAGGACNACSTSFVMNPVTRVDSPQFSPCSANEICSRYGVLGTCFADPGTRPVVSISQCGNGIVEDGEQCDCGGRDGCANNACCNTNCTLKAGATCDDKSDECCRSCQIVSNSTRTMCRPSRGECDRPEFCDGTSKLCPKDEFAPNGNTCQLTGEGVVGNVTTGTCASGQCTTRDQQCILRSQVAGVNATDIDEIMGECPNLFTGQCKLFCRSNVFGCRPLSGSFLDGTPCGKSAIPDCVAPFLNP
ncbi:Metallo-peptidase family M12-domain-containing protein [Catenaria anguillulae PL171]|uniref:Disintegrin and metalloproteinase domain-containing protein B n=1 Tax=Catenaria anguillulae PL171 TaxID=765915 RepID=A0A1Y2HW75_9FUNG|nr:Metallo-peptidase family M12-domain-containing protein [Catenaria anguillulae PL171]